MQLSTSPAESYLLEGIMKQIAKEFYWNDSHTMSSSYNTESVDQKVNDWLKANPDYEVQSVTPLILPSERHGGGGGYYSNSGRVLVIFRISEPRKENE